MLSAGAVFFHEGHHTLDKGGGATIAATLKDYAGESADYDDNPGAELRLTIGRRATPWLDMYITFPGL